MADKHEIVKRAFLNKTPAREDYFVLSVSNIIDVLPGQVIEASQVQDLFDAGVDVTINLPMPPQGGQGGMPPNGGPAFRDANTPEGAKKGCTSCGKKKQQQEAQAELESASVEEVVTEG
jgi:hypothetical protein